MKNYLDLSGKVALVTGAGSGIGRGAAIALAEAGAAVAINYHRNEAGAEEAKQKIVAGGGRAITIQADVTKSADAQRMVEETVAAFGPIDILVNNAGSLVERLRLLELTEARWDEVIDLNLVNDALKSDIADLQSRLDTASVAPHTLPIHFAAVIKRRSGAIQYFAWAQR